ncbi:MAG: hypothetical protein ONB46_15800 [candidate division KSB1 bacterium]|nr:hypothetical protein [candidate division KSB1 bacterium]MDZ7366815.1 hypothetical protein [candidate division KSB1 bacterium]MDZ7405178.1 hypothetical protein [candidate division KSB1 bacterium]
MFTRWLIGGWCLWVVAASWEPTLAQQKSLSGLFKTAPHVWLNDSLQTPLRPRLYLHGRWQVSSQSPQFSGEAELPATFAFEGEVEFQRSIRLDSTFMNRPLRLVMQGANYATQVRLNGELIGSHQGGYTPFVVDLRPERLFFDKENVLRLTVSNVLSPLQTLPPKHRPYGWLNEGGIGREIYLEALPEIFIEKTRLNYTLAPQAVVINLEVDLRLQKKLTPEETAGLAAVLEIWDAARRKKLAASAPLPLTAGDRLEQKVALDCQLNQPALWSPATPNLYALHVTLLRQNNLIDESWENTGFRKIEIVDRRLHVNGEPYIVRGANWIEDYGRHSALLDTTRLRELLAAVKELGANTIRVAGRPPHPLLPELCDRAGLFLLEELPLYHLTQAHFQQPQFFELAKQQAREMILRDAAHPSVLAWGVAVNSAMLAPTAKNNFKSFCDDLQQLDNRRLYAVAPLNWMADWEQLVDFILPDLFETENANAITAALNRSEKSNKPVLPIIGFWAAPVEVREKAASSAEGEQRQFTRLDEALKKFDGATQFAGYFIQALTDWPAAMPSLALGAQGGRLPHAASSMVFAHPAGIISSNGQRRPAFQLVQAFNRGDRRPMIMPRNVATVYPQEYPIVGLAVVLVLLFYLNRDRRLRGNLQRMFVHPHGFYVDINENRKVPPFLSALLGVAEGCIIALLLSGFCYANRTNLVFDQFLNLLIGDPAWKARVVWLIWHPSWFIAVVTSGLFALGLAAAVVMRILGFFLGRSLPVMQYFTFVFWTSSNLLVLSMIAPFFYRLLLYKDFSAPLLFLITAVLLWLVARFFRGMRVIYTMSVPRMMIIFGILVGGLVLSLVFYYQRNEAFFEYGKYYWQMLEGGKQ